MRTRAKSGFRLPQTRLNLHASPTLSPLPKTYKSALLDPNWSAAMRDEFQALQSNNTWQLVPRPPNANVVSGKWVFHQKFHSDGTLSLGIKRVGFVVGSLNNTVSITTKLSLP